MAMLNGFSHEMALIKCTVELLPVGDYLAAPASAPHVIHTQCQGQPSPVPVIPQAVLHVVDGHGVIPGVHCLITVLLIVLAHPGSCPGILGGVAVRPVRGVCLEDALGGLPAGKARDRHHRQCQLKEFEYMFNLLLA